MSTSNSWGIPVRKPRPDVVGFSWYFRVYSHDQYHRTSHAAWLHRLRRHLVHVLLGKGVFIHELQCEPWGPEAIWKMSVAGQDKSMDQAQITHNLSEARTIHVHPIDLWGAEWWYWRWLQGDGTIWRTVKDNLM